MADAKLICPVHGDVTDRLPDGALPACPECGAGLWELEPADPPNLIPTLKRPKDERKPDPRRRHAGPDRRRQEPQ